MLRAEIIGNIGSDAELKQLGNNTYISFNVAHSERDAQGQETTTWVSVLRYDNGNGRLLPLLKKGTKVYVAGSLRVNTYTDRGGNNRTSLDLNADVVQLCGSMPAQQAAPQQQQFAQQGNPFAPQADDLPF